MYMADFHECVDRANGVNEITVSKSIHYWIFGGMEEREEENKILITVGVFFNNEITFKCIIYR